MLKLLIALLPAFVWAAPETKTVVFKIKEGRELHVQVSEPAAGKDTFLFLPGVNRAVLLDEPAAKALIAEGYGVVAFNFSVQPISLAVLDKDTRPAFYRDEVTLKTLAEETQLLAKNLKTSYRIDKIIPVSLSYSGAVSSKLTEFSEAVDAVPLTSMDAFNPALAATRNALLAQEFWLGPFMGPANTRTWLDAAYKTAWVPQVRAISTQFNLPRERSDEMVDGYIRLSRATEGFEWSDRGDRTKRTFVIASNEAPAMLKHQLETLLKRLEGGRDEAVVLVMESGHVVPADQPAVYAQILAKQSAGDLKAGLTVVTPSANSWKHFSRAQALEKLHKLLRDLPDSGSGGTGNGATR